MMESNRVALIAATAGILIAALAVATSVYVVSRRRATAHSGFGGSTPGRSWHDSNEGSVTGNEDASTGTPAIVPNDPPVPNQAIEPRAGSRISVIR
jgi:hypothetical protein